MFKFFKKNFFWLIVVFILLFLLSYRLLGFDIKFEQELPAEFLTAKQEAADISQRIVELTGQTNLKIKEINFFDLNDDSKNALALIEETKEKNKIAYDYAFKLSESLRRMTEVLDRVPSLEKQRLAQAAIALELALIAEFITYTKLLNDFFIHLRLAILHSDNSLRQQIERDLSAINSKILIINNLNEQYQKKMLELMNK